MDFADVKTVLGDAGTAVMGIGKASGDNRAAQAAERAMASPLLETSMEGATGVLLSITGPLDLTLYEVNEAASSVQSFCESDAQIIFGATPDESAGEEFRVTVIAAGVGGSRRSREAVTTSTRPSRRSASERILSIPEDDPFDIPDFVEG